MPPEPEDEDADEPNEEAKRLRQEKQDALSAHKAEKICMCIPYAILQ